MPATADRARPVSATCPPTRRVSATSCEQRGLTLTGGTVFVALHKGADALEQGEGRLRRRDGRDRTQLGARHLVILPEGYTDLDGNADRSRPTLTDDEWDASLTG